MPKNYCIMQIWAESGKSALPICNYSQILYQFLTFTQNLKRSPEGQKRKDIASTLYISERTLSNHLQHIFEKLDVTSAVEAVTKAIQLGYIPPIC